MLAAGLMRDRLRFEARATADDGYGNVEGEWVAQCTVSARRKVLTGGEAVMGQRLAGRQPVVFMVRSSTDTRRITPAWRAVDVSTGTIYAILAAADPDGCREQIDILCESGVAP